MSSELFEKKKGLLNDLEKKCLLNDFKRRKVL